MGLKELRGEAVEKGQDATVVVTAAGTEVTFGFRLLPGKQYEDFAAGALKLAGEAIDDWGDAAGEDNTYPCFDIRGAVVGFLAHINYGGREPLANHVPAGDSALAVSHDPVDVEPLVVSAKSPAK